MLYIIEFTMILRLAFILIVFNILGCAGPRPILYPNEHFYSVGKTLADQDIVACKLKAKEFGANSGSGRAGRTARSTAVGAGSGGAIGAVGGAIAGSAGRGAVIGAATGATAGLVRSLFRSPKPSGTHVRLVNRCLRDRGYEVIGWE